MVSVNPIGFGLRGRGARSANVGPFAPTSGGGGGGTTFFQGDFTQSTEAAIGFNDNQTATDPNGRTTRTIVTGPGGRNAIKITHNPISEAAVTAIGNPQNTHGSAVNYGTFTGINQGESMFFHLYVKLDAMSDLKSWNSLGPPATTVDDACTVKMAIQGVDASRIILHLQAGNFYGGMRIRIAKNIDTGAGASVSVADGWTSLIFEAKSATTRGGSDGYVKCWKNSGTYASPTETLTGQLIDSTDASNVKMWTSWGWNQFGNETLASGAWTTPTLAYSIAGAKVTDFFDTNWHANMGS